MEELSFSTLIAVFEEMFGRGLFWVLAAVAAVITALYAYVLVRDRAVSMRKFLMAQLAMPFGAVSAVAFMLQITNSRLSDLGGPVDWLVVLGIAAAGAVGFAILVYVVQSLARRPHEEG